MRHEALEQASSTRSEAVELTPVEWTSPFCSRSRGLGFLSFLGLGTDLFCTLGGSGRSCLAGIVLARSTIFRSLCQRRKHQQATGATDCTSLKASRNDRTGCKPCNDREHCRGNRCKESIPSEASRRCFLMMCRHTAAAVAGPRSPHEI